METLAIVLKTLMRFKNYKNEIKLESLKKDVIVFIKDFNTNHEMKRAEGWSEEEQTEAIKSMKEFSK